MGDRGREGPYANKHEGAHMISYKETNRKRTRPSKMEVKQTGIIEQLDVHGHKERLDERMRFQNLFFQYF